MEPGAQRCRSKPGASLLRLSRNLGALTPGLTHVLLGSADIAVSWDDVPDYLLGKVPLDQVADTAKLVELGNLAGDLEKIRVNTSAAEVLVLMRHVDTADDARLLARLSDVQGTNTRHTLQALGKSRSFRLLHRLSDLTFADDRLADGTISAGFFHWRGVCCPYDATQAQLVASKKLMRHDLANSLGGQAMRKFLVVLDDSRECLNAMRFAAMRAAHTNGGVQILSVIPPDEFQHWIGVGDLMREEARERIHVHFEVFAKWMRDKQNIDPELVIREGGRRARDYRAGSRRSGHRRSCSGCRYRQQGPGPTGQPTVALVRRSADSDHDCPWRVVQGTAGSDHLSGSSCNKRGFTKLRSRQFRQDPLSFGGFSRRQLFLD